jgi:hypothetical protein
MPSLRLPVQSSNTDLAVVKSHSSDREYCKRSRAELSPAANLSAWSNSARNCLRSVLLSFKLAQVFSCVES